MGLNLKRILIILIAIIFVGIFIAWYISIDGPAEREQQSINLLKKEKQVFLSYINHFSKYSKILLILRSGDGYFEIEYTDNPNEKDPVKWDFKRLMLDLNNQNYYLSNENVYDSLEQALKTVNLSQKELAFWNKFFEKYNLYAIDTGIGHKFVQLTFNRFHIVPHGLLFVPPEDEEDWRYIQAQIPGRYRGQDTAVFHIMTHIEGRWFYFEGP